MGLFSRIFGNKKETDVWPQFAGRPNDKPLLREKAVALAPVLMQSGNHLIDAIRELIPATKIDTVTLLFELLMVKLHMVNRIALEQMGSDRRNWFMDPLENEIIDRLATLSEDAAKAAELKDGFWKHYTDRTQGYTNYAYAAEENEHGGIDVQRTIAWKLADNLGQGEDLATIMGLQVLITELVVVLFKNLQIRQLVGRLP